MHLLITQRVRSSPTTKHLLVGNTPPDEHFRVLISPCIDEEVANTNKKMICYLRNSKLKLHQRRS